VNFKKLCCLVIIIPIALSPGAFAASDKGYSISNAEQVIFSKNNLNSTDGDIKYLSLSSFKQNFDLVLQQRNQLKNGVSPSNKNIKLYAGKIQDKENSWARITVIGDRYTGAIFDGSELYMIDVGEDVDGVLTSDVNITDAKTVIYKSSEISSHLTCANHDSHESAFAYDNLLSDITRRQFNSGLTSIGVEERSGTEVSSDFEVASNIATRQVNLRIVVDPEYVSDSDLGAEAQVLSQMNIVDGIFTEQVGVQFGIDDIEVLSDNGSLTSTDSSTLLGQFRTFVNDDNPGLAHFFTGRDLDGNTVGIAGLRAICRASGVGVTEAGGRGAFGALIAAHEFGHNFGAPHDNQAGSACVNSPGTFLMNPSLNGSDQFSQCSLEQIADTLLGAQCLIPVNNAPAEPAASCEFSVDFSNGANDFEFITDPETPLYSSSSIFGGSLNTLVGGVDGADISNIEGVWSRQCLSDNGGDMMFSIRASLTQTSEYESDEFSQIALRINGTRTVLATLAGDGNGGVDVTTGTQQYSVNAQLDSGRNTIELVCFNNLKTTASESTECRFNSLETSEVSDDGLCLPIKTQDSRIAVICL